MMKCKVVYKNRGSEKEHIMGRPQMHQESFSLSCLYDHRR